MPPPVIDSDPLPIHDSLVLENFAVRDQREISRVVRELAKRNIQISVYRDDQHLFRTLILDVSQDNASIVLDAEPSPSPEPSGEWVCVTRLDKVKIQFTVKGLRAVTHAGYPALSAPMPETLLRLQRREYFRVATPLTEPLLCMIPQTDSDGRELGVPVRILDLSAGGLAVVVPPESITLEPGSEFERCSLRIPDGEPLSVRLKIRNLFTVSKPNGIRVKRAGCEFIGLSNAASARIQRYLFKLERDQRNAGSEQ